MFKVGLFITLLISPTLGFWRLPCSHAIVVERADPIIFPGKASPHVHVVAGSNKFSISAEYEDLVQGTCSSCEAFEDMSAYWIPQPYFHWKNGSFTQLQTGGMTIYYLLTTHPDDPSPIQAFPEGLKIVTGNPFKRAYDIKVHRDDESFGWRCIGATIDGKENPFTPDFPKQNCPLALRAEVRFPPCWNGVDLDSENHASHMAYPEVLNGPCTKDFPKRFATLLFEFWFTSAAFANNWGDAMDPTQPFVLSQGDPTGYGLHADFQNGWNTEVLQKAVTECTDDTGVIDKCQHFTLKKDADCNVAPQVNEVATGTVDKLPGCNPIFKGPEDAPKDPKCDGDNGEKNTEENNQENKENQEGKNSENESPTATKERPTQTRNAQASAEQTENQSSGSQSGFKTDSDSNSKTDTNVKADSTSSADKTSTNNQATGEASVSKGNTASSSLVTTGGDTFSFGSTAQGSTPSSSSQSSAEEEQSVLYINPWIAVGAGLVVILILAGIYVCVKRRKHHHHDRDMDDEDERALGHPLLMERKKSSGRSRRYDY